VAATELFLEIADIPKSLKLFLKEKNSDGSIYIKTNPEIVKKYFFKSEFLAPSFHPEYFTESKAPGTFRIFCFGESALEGFPFPSGGSIPYFLKQNLSVMFPGTNFEVINLGITGINSFAVADFTEEAMDYSPDLLIYYMGHNEFYGALVLPPKFHPENHLRLLIFPSCRELKYPGFSHQSLKKFSPARRIHPKRLSSKWRETGKLKPAVICIK